MDVRRLELMVAADVNVVPVRVDHLNSFWALPVYAWSMHACMPVRGRALERARVQSCIFGAVPCVFGRA